MCNICPFRLSYPITECYQLNNAAFYMRTSIMTQKTDIHLLILILMFRLGLKRCKICQSKPPSHLVCLLISMCLHLGVVCFQRFLLHANHDCYRLSLLDLNSFHPLSEQTLAGVMQPREEAVVMQPGRDFLLLASATEYW